MPCRLDLSVQRVRGGLPTRDAQADRTTRIAIVNGPEFGYELIEGGMALRVNRDRVDPTAVQAMCAVPRKRKFPEHYGSSQPQMPNRNFEPFRLAEAYD
jgi:hypothetical protein